MPVGGSMNKKKLSFYKERKNIELSLCGSCPSGKVKEEI
jgi:hypothetical protein